MTVELTQDNLDFAAAFEEGLQDGIAAVSNENTTPAEPAAEAPAPATNDTAPASDVPATSPSVVPGGDNGEPAAAETPPAEPAPAAAPAAPAAIDWEARARALEAQVAAQQNKQPEPAPAPAAAPAPIYSPEEQEVLNTYQQDWPDIAKAEALTRRQEYKQLLDYVFTQMEQRIAPIAQSTETYQADTHYTQLTKAHPDYDDIVDSVEAWIDTQPEFLKKSLTEVAKSGDTKDVIGLVSMYKQATGIQPKQAQTTPPTVTPPVVTQPTITQSAKQTAAQRLSPVSTQRTQAQAPAGAEDFDSAFAEFARE